MRDQDRARVGKRSAPAAIALLLFVAASAWAGEYDYLIDWPPHQGGPPSIPESILARIPTADLAALVVKNMQPMMWISLQSKMSLRREPMMEWLEVYNGTRELFDRENLASGFLACYGRIRVAPPIDPLPPDSLWSADVYTLENVEILASDERVLDRAMPEELRGFLETALAKLDERVPHPDTYSPDPYAPLLIGGCLDRLGSSEYAAWIEEEANQNAMLFLRYLDVRGNRVRSDYELRLPLIDMARRFLADEAPDSSSR